MIKVAVSGGFDPVHKGHIKYFKEAKKLGNELTVILNSDRFLMEKKGFVFMPFRERKTILESIKYIDKVIPCVDKDKTVCETLKRLKPNIFVNGGDRTRKNIPEKDTCKKHNIKMMFSIGGTKVQSSSWLINNVKYIK